MKQREWSIQYRPPEIPEALLREGYPPLLAAILAARGLTDPEAADTFLNIGPEALYDPMGLRGMDKAVQRIREAMQQGERVAVYGDYDVDGITSTCLLTDYLRRQGVDCVPYIPDRIREGYGVNADAVRSLAGRGVKLIITVDCGITAIDEAAIARSLGVDMVITDHHECGGQSIPAACAVVDPKQPDCSYPNPGLAGVGVAFKLVCALEGSHKNVLPTYGDLAAIGTVADVMPLTGENRFLVSYGLALLQRDPRPGLRALLTECGALEKEITATTVGFTLAPRINAAGRLGQTSVALRLLLTRDDLEADRLAAQLCELNRERQFLEQEIWDEASDRARTQAQGCPLVLTSDDWHQGVIGIAASRLSESFHLPTIMIRFDGDRGKGSCRSFGGFNLYKALAACSDVLEGFGGHALAAGLTIRRENIDRFRKAITDYYQSNPAETLPALQFDLRVANPTLLSLDNIAALSRLEPCGSANAKPQLCMTGVRLLNVVPIGAGRHLRLQVELADEVFDCIYFSCTAEELGVRRGDWIDLAFCPQVNHFRGRDSVQLLVTDVRRSEETALCKMVLRGETVSDWDAAARCPRREDFILIWRWLTAPARLPLDELARYAPGGMHPVQLCLCLKIMEEMGLVRLQLEDDSLLAAPVEGCAKVDLNRSALLKRLRTAQRQVRAG
ncbi:MAG: single-stranded-DNA-specific exonuclease RecJ [Oscillospiraceae bacterium]|nr:single-stranded-DNA-specific exonuclease RecJ [Oscillospiraceae bacterium]